MSLKTIGVGVGSAVDKLFDFYVRKVKLLCDVCPGGVFKLQLPYLAYGLVTKSMVHVSDLSLNVSFPTSTLGFYG